MLKPSHPPGVPRNKTLDSRFFEHRDVAVYNRDVDDFEGVNIGGASSIKAPMRAATVAALPAYTHSFGVLTANANGALGAQDGIALVAGDRLAVVHESGANAPYNGFYRVRQAGSSTTRWILERTSDANTDLQVFAGIFARIERGVKYGGKALVLRTENPIALGTTALQFSPDPEEVGTAAPVADVAALRAVVAANRMDGQTRLVSSSGLLYRFESSGAGADDGSGTIQPTDVSGSDPGRWFNIGAVANSYDDASLSTQDPTTGGAATVLRTVLTNLHNEITSNADATHVHEQSSPSASWAITHNLGKYPSVTVVDSAGSVVIGDVTYNNLNQVTLSFGGAFSGKAFFN
jgi:hypothetical protein